jgi:probable H4MPT-linked C1 transfer pathway protein
MANTIIGWDIGGAHLKMARLDGGGRLHEVQQFALPLWRGPDRLGAMLAELAGRPGLAGCRHAVTMTGELADCFGSRAEGVTGILAQFTGVFPAAQTRVYAGADGLLEVEAARGMPEKVASANWLATAEYLAQRLRDGILVDIGSTTTDIIPFRDGRPGPRGRTDHTRLQSGELVYTGVVRTPVMAVVSRVPFRDRWQGIAAENFATMADIYRLTGQLAPEHDQAETPDGAGKSETDSRRRLARMVGLDLDAADPPRAWQQLAEHIAAEQLNMISEAIKTVSTRTHGATGTLLVGAGCGRFLLPELARRLDCRCEDFADQLELQPHLRGRAADNAAAVALAQLGLRELS